LQKAKSDLGRAYQVFSVLFVMVGDPCH